MYVQRFPVDLSIAVEGWVIFVSGIHPEATEDDLREQFLDFGKIKNFHLNLDRKSGYVKGYALIEYRDRAEAEAAVAKMNGEKILGQAVHVDWAFVGESNVDVSTGRSHSKKHRN